MKTASEAPASRPGRSKLDPELDTVLSRLAEAKRIVATAKERRDAAIKEAIKTANDEYIEAVGTAEEDVVTLHAQLTAFMERNHYSLVRRLSRTIKRTFGTVFVVLRAKELDVPADLKPMSWLLFHDEEGEKYLKPYVPQVDTTALGKAIEKGEVSPRLMRKLHGMGVRFGHHLTFLVKSPTDAKAITISRRLYRPHRTEA